MKDEYSIICAMALNKFFGENPKIGSQFIKYFGSTEAIYKQNREELFENLRVRFPDSFNDELIKSCEKEYRELQNLPYKILTIEDTHYPTRLKECPDAPFVLYIRCNVETSLLFHRPSVAIVGTRNMTPYGRECTRKLVFELSKLKTKPLIVSGLAYGIDITAHLSALEYGLPTVGVSPVGINDIYPNRHISYANKIVYSAGAIISDFPIGSALYQSNFLRRNRIIAGLGDCTVLVESKIKGGGLMTARLAGEYSRSVFAIPGRMDDITSQGCNDLISKNMAACLSSYKEVIETLGFNSTKKAKSVKIEDLIRESFKDTLRAEELEILVAIYTLIKKCRGISLDELCLAGNMDIVELSSYIALLEKEAFITTDLMQCCSINKFV